MRVTSVPPAGVADSAIIIAVAGVFFAIALVGVAIPAGAVIGVAGVVGAPAPASWLTGGHAPPPPPLPAGCEPDSPDPACHPPPPHRRRPHFTAPAFC